ncbi:MITA [Mytilus edulis]|uniref:TMEM173 n=1 Tax=Mytilus edulis TaxID=6550 RepID=A0A8S3SEE2_MYTED|nr:MITA [Mytilus edulis]
MYIDQHKEIFLKGLLDLKRMTAIKVFLSHSNELDDQQLVYDEILPKLEVFKDISILTQDELQPGQIFLSSLTELVDKVDKTLLFITKNAMQSSWCSLELLIGLERSQRKQQLSVVLLLHGIEEKDIPQIAVLQEARKIIFTKENDSWVTETVERIREKETIKQLMPAGNVAHGLVWSHYAGLLQYILPDLENNLKESEWYKDQSILQNHVSTKFYEMVPTSCTCHFDLSKIDDNIKLVKVLELSNTIRGGNVRKFAVKLYSITDGDQTYFCICEYPSAIGAMKAMEDHHLAKFSIDDKKLQLARFYYTMNSVINHFDISRNKARVVLFNDETEKVSEVLVKAIKQDLQLTEKVMPKESPIRPKLEDLEPTPELEYQYQVYIAHSENTEDKQSAKEIIEYLEQKGIHSILKNPDSPNDPENSVKDKMLQLRVLAALHDGILKRRVRVIPVVDRRNDIYIPDALQWVTYVPYNGQTKSHLKSLHNIVSGEDFPLKTEMLLPAGDVANGLAWGYVVNYLRVILPDEKESLAEIMEAKII